MQIYEFNTLDMRNATEKEIRTFHQYLDRIMAKNEMIKVVVKEWSYSATLNPTTYFKNCVATTPFERRRLFLGFYVSAYKAEYDKRHPEEVNDKMAEIPIFVAIQFFNNRNNILFVKPICRLAYDQLMEVKDTELGRDIVYTMTGCYERRNEVACLDVY